MVQNNQDEIDLGYLFNKISSLFRSFVRLLFLVISFFIKYIIVVVVLIIIGIALGYYFDKNKTEVYNNELIVIPNFESTQYFYDKVDALSSKLRDGDAEFLEATIGPNYIDLRGLEAEPIIDIFTFASLSRERVDLFKVITDKQDIPDYIKDPQNFQYYKYQHLTVKIKGKEHSQEIIDRLIIYFNDSPHFIEYLEAETTKFRIDNYEKTISKIDTILIAAANIENNKGASPSVLVNDNSQLNDLVESRERLVYNLSKLYIQNVDEQKIVKVASVNYNVSDFSGIHISNKVKYPFFLVLLFSGFFFLKNVYRKMKQIAETDAK
jgi:uncharacterized membrane protein